MSASRGACSTRGVMQPLFQNVAENSACKSRNPPFLPISRTEAKGCAWSTWTRWKRASGPPQMASLYQPTHIPKDRRLTRHGPTVGAITILKTKMVSRWKVPKGERRKRPGLSPGLFVWGASNGFVFARCRRSLVPAPFIDRHLYTSGCVIVAQIRPKSLNESGFESVECVHSTWHRSSVAWGTSG